MSSWTNVNSTTGVNKYTSMYVKGFLDISGGNLVIRNNHFFLNNGDASMGGRLFVLGDTSLNSRLFVSKDVSMNGNLSVAGRSIGLGSSAPAYPIDISGTTRIANAGLLGIQGNVISTQAAIISQIDGFYNGANPNGLVVSPYNFNTGYGRTAFLNDGGLLPGGFEFYAGLDSQYTSSITAPMVAYLSPGNCFLNGNVAINFNNTTQLILNANPPLYTLDVSGMIHTINDVNNKKIVLSDQGQSDSPLTATNFYGFGVNSGILRYQAPTSAVHNFYAGSSYGQINALVFNSASDYRIKENVEEINGKFTVDDLRPVHYFNKDSQKEDIGFIAHEVQELFPFLVTGTKDGEQTQTLNYTGLIGILVKEIQELKKRVKSLEQV